MYNLTFGTACQYTSRLVYRLNDVISNIFVFLFIVYSGIISVRLLAETGFCSHHATRGRR